MDFIHEQNFQIRNDEKSQEILQNRLQPNSSLMCAIYTLVKSLGRFASEMKHNKNHV